MLNVSDMRSTGKIVKQRKVKQSLKRPGQEDPASTFQDNWHKKAIRL